MGGGRKEAQQGGDISKHTADSRFVQQKSTHYCKAVILQFKKKNAETWLHARQSLNLYLNKVFRPFISTLEFEKH